MSVKLVHGDCLKEMQNIPDGSIDLCLTDPPYGTTACKWDSVIPFEPMWAELKRIVKPNGAICLFGSEPFSSHLRMSNIKMFKYDWIWDKKIPSGMCNAKIMPMRQSELISVFIDGKNFYYPQMIKRDNSISHGGKKEYSGKVESKSGGTSGLKLKSKVYTHKYPTTHLVFDKIRRGSVHPTQKPVPLLEYLIKTYTLEGESVLDFTMGSGSTGVAAKNLNRSFIGIEQDAKYFEIAKKRIEEHEPQLGLL